MVNEERKETRPKTKAGNNNHRRRGYKEMEFLFLRVWMPLLEDN